jgi:hypothetical protein
MYSGCIQLLNRSAVSTARGAAVAHLFTLEAVTGEPFPSPEVPGHLEWVPLLEALALLAPVIPDHADYCAAVRKAAL